MKALLQLKNDPQKHQWQYIYDDLRKRFPDESSLPAVNKEMLQKAYGRIDPALRAAPDSQQGASTAGPHAPVGGSYDTSQAGYNTTYAASQSYPGSSYAASQSNPGGAFGGPQSGLWAQHAPSQMGSGGPYAPTPNTNPQSRGSEWHHSHSHSDPYAAAPNMNPQHPQMALVGPAWNPVYGHGDPYASTTYTSPQLPPLASFDPAWRQSCGYGGQYASPPNTSQQLPSVGSFAPGGNQGHAHGGSYAMAPGMETGQSPDQAGDVGFDDQYMHRSPLDSVGPEQRQWIFERGLNICPGYGWKNIEQEYLEEFDDNGLDYHRLKEVFDEMRNQRG